MMEDIPTLSDERIQIKTPEVDLWLAVIDQAIGDLSDPDLCNAAAEWFTSTSDQPGTFLWICEQLDFDAPAVRSALFKRAMRITPRAPSSRRAQEPALVRLIDKR